MKTNQDFAQGSGENNGEYNSFYNTVHLQGVNLVKAKRQAETQESKVLDFLRVNSALSFTKYEIKTTLVSLGKINAKTPESSISRALSNLCKDGKILKLEEMSCKIRPEETSCSMLLRGLSFK